MPRKNEVPHAELLDQFNIIYFATKNADLSGCDIAVLAEVTNRFLKAKGVTMPTSAGHLVRETGRTERAVQGAISKLQELGYIARSELGRGTRGNTYTLNIPWVRFVAQSIAEEIAARAKAKKSRRKGKSPSYAPQCPTNDESLATHHSAPLRELVTHPAAYLNSAATHHGAPQTYVGTTVPLRRCDTAPAYGLTPTQGGTPLKKKIVAAVLEEEEGENWLALELEEEDGARDEAYILLESPDRRKQDGGQRELQQLCIAADITGDLENAASLVGRSVMVTGLGEFLPVPANDDDHDKREAA